MIKLQQLGSAVYQMKVGRCVPVVVQIHYFTQGNREVHSFNSLSYDRSKVSSKASSPYSAI
jgi:hypothetical protein